MKYVAHILGLLLVVAVATPGFAAEKNVGARVKNTVKGGVVGTTSGIKTGGGVAELTSWDCQAVGGTVVTPGDDRCGIGGKYCRMPDTNAVCIEEKAR